MITSWFVGYTPQVATAVTYSHGTGYKPIDDGYLPRGYFGATYPAETWTAAMKRIMDGVEVEQFPKPANLDGDAPTSGHEPYTPPPPKKTKTKVPTPTTTPEPVANGVCSAYGFPQDPDCPPPGQSPTPTPTPTEPTATCTGLGCIGGGGGGGGGQGGGRLTSSDFYARPE